MSFRNLARPNYVACTDVAIVESSRVVSVRVLVLRPRHSASYNAVYPASGPAGRPATSDCDWPIGYWRQRADRRTRTAPATVWCRVIHDHPPSCGCSLHKKNHFTTNSTYSLV